MGNFSVETRPGAILIKKLATRIKQFGKNQNAVSEPILPSGLTVNQAVGKFEAVVEAIETARHEQEIVPADLKLTDFEISPAAPANKIFQAHLLPSTATRAAQLPNQDQPALSRLLYALVAGEPLTAKDDLKLALTRLSVATPDRPAMPEVVEVIEHGLHNLYHSLNELDGAFGWAMYRYAQAVLLHRHSLIAIQPNLLGLSDSEWQLARQDSSLKKTLRRNVWVVTGLAGIGLLAVVCLIIVLNKPNLFGSNSPQNEAVANSSTATIGTSKSNATQPNATGSNSQKAAASIGATPYQVDMVQAKVASRNLSKLKVGQAAVWNAPNIVVTGQNWQGYSEVDVATNDGNYTNYDSRTSENVLTTTNGLQSGYKLACWSPNGKNLAIISAADQVILKRAANSQNGETSFPLPPLSGSNQTTLYNTCESLFSWSPDSQKLLLFAQIPQLWNFSAAKIQQIEPDNTISYDVNADTTIWSPDSSQFGIFVKDNDQGSQTTFNVYDANSLNLSGSINDYVAPTQQNSNVFFSVSNSQWSPNGKNIASLLGAENYSNRQPLMTESIQIFTVPKDIGAPGQPLKPDLIQTNVVITNTLHWAFLIAPKLAWSPDGSKLALAYNSLADNNSGQARPTQSGHIAVYSVDATDKIKLLYTQDIGNYLPNYLAWSPEGDRLLTADNLGNLRIWPLPRSGNNKNQISSNYWLLNEPASANADIVSTPQWSPDGKYVAATDLTVDNRIGFFSAVDGQELFQADLNQQQLQIFDPNGQWSPDGQFFAAQVAHVPSNQGSGVNEILVAVWKIENNQAEFYGTIPLKNAYGSINDSFAALIKTNVVPQWTFSADITKPALLILDNKAEVYSYDLSKPLAQAQAALIPVKPAGLKTSQIFVTRVINNNSVGISSTDTTTNTATASTDAGSSQEVKIGEFTGITLTTELTGSWSNNRDMLIAGSNGRFKLYKFSSPTQNAILVPIAFNLFSAQTQNLPQIVRVVFSADDKLVAFGIANGSIQIYNTATGRLVTTVEATDAKLIDLVFSADGKYLATSASDRVVKLWEVSDQSYWPLAQLLQGDISLVRHLAFAADSHYLLTEDVMGTVLIWRLS